MKEDKCNRKFIDTNIKLGGMFKDAISGFKMVENSHDEDNDFD